MYLFFWLFICILYKLVNISVFLSFVSCYSKLSNLMRGSWESTFVTKLDRSVDNLGTHYVRLASEVGGSLVGLSP